MIRDTRPVRSRADGSTAAIATTCRSDFTLWDVLFTIPSGPSAIHPDHFASPHPDHFACPHHDHFASSHHDHFASPYYLLLLFVLRLLYPIRRYIQMLIIPRFFESRSRTLRSTSVERSLQIHLFMQNEPKLRKPEMTINYYTQRTYKDPHLLEPLKNEPKRTQNEPKPKNAKMIIFPYSKRAYKNFHPFALFKNEPKRTQNEPKTNPNFSTKPPRKRKSLILQSDSYKINVRRKIVFCGCLKGEY